MTTFATTASCKRCASDSKRSSCADSWQCRKWCGRREPLRKHANRHSQTHLQGVSTLGTLPLSLSAGLWNLWNKSALPQKSKQSVSHKRTPGPKGIIYTFAYICNMTFIFTITTWSLVPNKFQAEQFAPVGERDL